MDDRYETLRSSAAGRRSDYMLDPRPLSDEGGQGQVFGAIHRSTGLRVAFKRLRVQSSDAVARMNREIEIGRRLTRHPNVVPLLDADADGTWFVMPLASGNAELFRDELRPKPGALRRMVEHVMQGLAAAHALGWIHRDIKPANILRWGDGTWALGDWGFGRRPRGQTTHPGRTRVGVLLGTMGFAAPELSVDAHEATPAADIFSLGQVVGWALTGTMPQANVPLLPAGGPWWGVVKAATQLDPRRRPQDCAAFMRVISGELDEPPEPPATRGEQLLAELYGGRRAALQDLWTFAARNKADYDLYIDVLPQLADVQVRDATRTDPVNAGEIARSLGEHLGGSWGNRPFRLADKVIRLAHGIAMCAAEIRDWDLLNDASETLYSWDSHWDQWRPQHVIRSWMGSLSGDAARIVAAVLRRNPASAAHFTKLAEDRAVDGRLRAAVRADGVDTVR